MRQDRFLIAILCGILGLVVLAIALFFVRRDQPAYSTEDTPQAVIHNYTLALQRGEYARAYTYLTDRQYKPNQAEFQQAFIGRENEIASTGIEIGEQRDVVGEVLISVTILRSRGWLFGDVYRDVQPARLEKSASGWRIVSMPYPFWDYSWYQVQPSKTIPESLPKS